MQYQYLSQDYRDDVLAGALLDREKEWFHYDFDRQNFASLALLTQDKEYKAQLLKNIGDIQRHQERVGQLITVLQSQILDPVRHQAAVQRVLAARAKE